MSDFPDQILETLFNAVAASMDVVRNGQSRSTTYKIKAEDNTVVTPTDIESERVAFEILNRIPCVSFVGEEGSSIPMKPGYRRGLFDPLDGTGAFAARLKTSTVIAGLYNQDNTHLEYVVIGNAATGDVWFAQAGVAGPSCYHCIDGVNNSGFPTDWQQVKVWEGEMNSKAQMYLDVSHGFSRKGREILSTKQLGSLFVHLNTEVKVLIPGSNGLMHALVANGGKMVAGSITTAMGGAWDACGALLVAGAGGALRAFSVNDGSLEEKNPLDPLSYDILVTGNSFATVNRLTDILRLSM